MRTLSALLAAACVLSAGLSGLAGCTGTSGDPELDAEMARYEAERQAREDEKVRACDADPECARQRSRERVQGTLLITALSIPGTTVGPTALTNATTDANARRDKRIAFLDTHYEPFLQQMAAGRGDRLDVFLAAICPDSWSEKNGETTYYLNKNNAQREPFGRLMQARLEALVPADRDPTGLHDRIAEAMSRHAIFSDCRDV